MTDRILHIDYETRSVCNLIKEGVYRYATHPSTEVICLGYAFDEGPVQMWTPDKPFPAEIGWHLVGGASRSIHAHNAAFERLITTHVLNRMVEGFNFDTIPLDAWYCTAAQARARALPGNLEDLGRCLGLKTQKDRRGKELIKLLSIPATADDGSSYFRKDPGLLQEMYDYCATDVVVERAAAEASPPLTDEEFAAYIANELVNDRGLLVDLDFADAACEYADAELKEICAELSRITGGAVTTPKQYDKVKKLLAPLMAEDDDVRKAMTRHKTDRRTGEETVKIAFDKDARFRIRGLEEATPGRIPQDIMAVLELVDDAGKSSVAKYQNMVMRASEDERVRGAYMFSGAGQTGRFSSKGLQVHNMPRNTAKDPDAVRDNVLRGQPLDGVMSTLSSMLRPSIISADGHTFVCGDWSSIEARMLPWLSGSNGGSRVLEVFENQDKNPDLPDVYEDAAAGIYSVRAEDVTKDQRLVGKVTILACGYQGGYRAFQSMAQNYSLTISDDMAEDIVRDWRAANSWATDFWHDLFAAACNAVKYPGGEHTVGLVTYCMPEDGAPLYCMLPSGRPLAYPEPRLEMEETKYGPRMLLSAVKAQWRPGQDETEWPRVNLYGGILAENITQAAAADVLRDALIEMDGLDWPIVGHTHDELLLEVRDDEVDEAFETLQDVMLKGKGWTAGLPLNAELWTGKRYGKG